MSEPFKNKRQIYKALLDGLTITNGKGNWKVKLSSDDLLYGIYGNDKKWTPEDFNFNNVKYWSIYEEPKWYDNIPECGVLCTNCHDRVVLIKEKLSTGYKDNNCIIWDAAEPLTKEELMQYIWKGEDEKEDK